MATPHDLPEPELDATALDMVPVGDFNDAWRGRGGRKIF